MSQTVQLFVGFEVYPSDFLKQIEETRRIDCGHDPSADAKFCDECGTRLQRIDLKVELREEYKNTFDPPTKRYQSLEEPMIRDWLEFKAIRSNYSVDTDYSEGPSHESKSVVVGRELDKVDLASAPAETSSTGYEEVTEAAEAAEELRDELEIDREVSIHLVQKVN